MAPLLKWHIPFTNKVTLITSIAFFIKLFIFLIGSLIILGGYSKKYQSDFFINLHP
jgi:hypothetical protein